MSRAQIKRLNTEDEVTEVPLVKEIMIRDEDMEPVQIRSFEDLPWNRVKSNSFSSKIKRLFRS